MVAIDIRGWIKLYAFQLTKQQLLDELVSLNASSAHGTKKANLSNGNIELRMSLKIDVGMILKDGWEHIIIPY